MKRETRYLNTDLDLGAPRDLAPLADALAHRGLFVFHVWQWEDGLWSARFATEEPFLEPDQNIAAMLTAIEALDEPSRSLWEACTIRKFDIGYDCGYAPYAFNQQLSTATLARIAAAGAAVVITLYPVIETDAHEAAVKILKKDKSIQSHIGKYDDHICHYTELPSSKENLPEVKVTLYGNKGSVYVHCRMELKNQAGWRLKEIIKKEERSHPANT